MVQLIGLYWELHVLQSASSGMFLTRDCGQAEGCQGVEVMRDQQNCKHCPLCLSCCYWSLLLREDSTATTYQQTVTHFSDSLSLDSFFPTAEFLHMAQIPL